MLALRMSLSWTRSVLHRIRSQTFLSVKSAETAGALTPEDCQRLVFMAKRRSSRSDARESQGREIAICKTLSIRSQ